MYVCIFIYIVFIMKFRDKALESLMTLLPHYRMKDSATPEILNGRTHHITDHSNIN